MPWRNPTYQPEAPNTDKRQRCHNGHSDGPPDGSDKFGVPAASVTSVEPQWNWRSNLEQSDLHVFYAQTEVIAGAPVHCSHAHHHYGQDTSDHCDLAT
eukprot:CAMPEP_0168429330 /NCGR_PEP_ID=MMETSP0228-20121227/37315_1 /TAXON_ID=133427 /ORGANISM="Protoceratium reticulatum, Strain CCCM 535 (=CCMP 1889)" /LENGTH=97 /DNA_ID=CAMNT_0008443413 /DNA_START=257 /DNA_END=547 /DNA_ORIENTATION=+